MKNQDKNIDAKNKTIVSLRSDRLPPVEGDQLEKLPDDYAKAPNTSKRFKALGDVHAVVNIL